MQSNSCSDFLQSSFLMQTRSDEPTNKTFIDSMLDPNAAFGGLYTFGHITPFRNIQELYTLSYKEICKKIFKQLNIDLSCTRLGTKETSDDILESALASYDNFRTKEIAPLVQIEPNLYSLELYHGPTYAFKDMALQPFSKLLNSIAIKQNKKYLILSATSGDTGPATLQGFADSKNIKAICIYPRGGTSEIQRLQMTTQSAQNLKVFGIDGDFDCAQSSLKSLLKHDSFRQTLKQSGYELSAANSVNIARIAFQIAYYFIIAKELYKQGKNEFSVIVPSGNFGNALGAFFARQLGLPIKKIRIASNPNDILKEFFTTGQYDITNKTLKLSYSPAMDILKSSNIERLLFAYFGAKRTRELMESLDNTKRFSLTQSELTALQEVFEAKSFSDDECLFGIKTAFKNGYILDPHTSNAYLFAKQCNDAFPQVIISTAHFSKFAKAVYMALSDCTSKDIQKLSDNEALIKIQDILKQHGKNHELNDDILELFTKKEIHTQCYKADTLQEHIIKWIQES